MSGEWEKKKDDHRCFNILTFQPLDDPTLQNKQKKLFCFSQKELQSETLSSCFYVDGKILFKLFLHGVLLLLSFKSIFIKLMWKSWSSRIWFERDWLLFLVRCAVMLQFPSHGASSHLTSSCGIGQPMLAWKENINCWWWCYIDLFCLIVGLSF